MRQPKNYKITPIIFLIKLKKSSPTQSILLSIHLVEYCPNYYHPPYMIKSNLHSRTWLIIIWSMSSGSTSDMCGYTWEHWDQPYITLFIARSIYRMAQKRVLERQKILRPALWCIFLKNGENWFFFIFSLEGIVHKC